MSNIHKRPLTTAGPVRQTRQKRVSVPTSSEFARQLENGAYVLSSFNVVGKVKMAKIRHKDPTNKTPINFSIGSFDDLRRVPFDADVDNAPKIRFQIEASGDETKVAIELDKLVQAHVQEEITKSLDCRKQFSKEKLTDMHSHLLKRPSDPKYKPTIQISAYEADHKYATKFFEFEGATPRTAKLKPIDKFESLPSNSKVTLVCTPAWVWFSGKGFGITLVSKSLFIKEAVDILLIPPGFGGASEVATDITGGLEKNILPIDETSSQYVFD